MRTLALLLALALLAPPPALAMNINEQWKLALGDDFLYYDNSVTGSDKAGSFLTLGHYAVHNLNLGLNYTKGERNFEFVSEGRMADDEKIEAKRHTLKKLAATYVDPKHDAAVGDVLAAFSGYVLGASMKGARYTRKWGETADFTIIGGLEKPNWEDLWTHKANETIERRHYGVRYAKRFAGEASVSANVSWTKDAHSKTAPGQADVVTPTLDQRIFGADWALPTVKGLRLYGESAFSHTETDNPANVHDDPITADKTQSGQAHAVKADYVFKRFKTQNAFERVSPDYATSGGAASPDLIKYNTQNTLTLSGAWKFIMLNYTWFHNNLNHAEGQHTTTTRVPESGIRFEGPDARPDFSAEVKLRDRVVTKSDTGLRSRSRSIASNWADRIGPFAASFDYEYVYEDTSDETAKSRHHTLGGGLQSAHDIKGIKLAPSLRWNMQRDRDNLTDVTDQTMGYTGTLSVETPWDLTGGFSYSRSLTLSALSPGNDKRVTNFNVGYRRWGQNLEVRFKQNDNRFEEPDKDFKEMVWEVALKTTF